MITKWLIKKDFMGCFRVLCEGTKKIIGSVYISKKPNKTGVLRGF